MNFLFQRHLLILTTLLVAGSLYVFQVQSVADLAVANASDSSSEVEFVLRSRSGGSPGEETCITSHEKEVFDLSKTAVVVVDMWERHWCERMTSAGGAIAPKINAFITEARNRGATIIHCPSGGGRFFEGHAALENARNAPSLRTAPNGYTIRGWNRQLESEPYPMMIDRTPLAGCPCETRCRGSVSTRQAEEIEVYDNDYITSSGSVLLGVLVEKEIEHVLYTGEAIERCVLGRPFGARHMIACGFDVHLVRDLVDGMHFYPWIKELSPEMSNHMSLEHVERYIAPTVISASLLDPEHQEAISLEAEDNGPAPRLAFVSEGTLENGETFRLYAKVGSDEYECVIFGPGRQAGEHQLNLSSLLTQIDLDLTVEFAQLLMNGEITEANWSDNLQSLEASFTLETPARSTLVRVTLRR